MPRNGSGVYSPPAGTTATTGTIIESPKYNAFVADLTADANAVRPVVAGGTGVSSLPALLTALGAQPLDAALTSISGLTTTADRMIYTTASDVYAVAPLTAAGRALLDDADAAAQRTTLGLVIGTDVQAYGATLTSLEGLSLVAGDLLYATAADTLVRLPKGTALQALRMNAGATAPEWAAPMFSKSFTSADQTITVAGLVTVAHGLGAAPSLIQFSLRCTSTDAGFAVNDVIVVSVNNSTGAARNNACYFDATNINVRFSDTAAPFTTANKSTGASATLDPAKWVLIIRAWV